MKKRKTYLGFVEGVIILTLIANIVLIALLNMEMTEKELELAELRSVIKENKEVITETKSNLESAQLTMDWQTTQVYEEIEKQRANNDNEFDSITDKMREISSQRVILSNEELKRFYALVMAESGGESLSCQKAVASTVINRILNNEFPSSLKDVMNQRNAFSVLYDGSIDKYEPTESVITAVKLSLYEDYADGSLYFLNYDLAVAQGYEDNANNMVNSFEFVFEIDNVTFLK